MAKGDVLPVMRKQVGKDAGAMLTKVDKMLKQGATHEKIKKVLAADLCTHLRKQMKHFMEYLVPPKGRP